MMRGAEGLAALAAMNIDALRLAWSERFGEEPPKYRAADLLRRALANRLQEETLGRDPDLERRIAALVRAHLRGDKAEGPKPSFRRGVILKREYGGVVHEVEVIQDGFRWNGQTFKSLSQIARQITGVRWNGPRFFGLRGPTTGARA